MKSWNLAATILVLTGSLGALDLSGAIGVEPQFAVESGAPVASTPPALSPASANADAEERDDEPDAELVNTFLVSPRDPALARARAAAALRFD